MWSASLNAESRLIWTPVEGLRAPVKALCKLSMCPGRRSLTGPAAPRPSPSAQSAAVQAAKPQPASGYMRYLSHDRQGLCRTSTSSHPPPAPAAPPLLGGASFSRQRGNLSLPPPSQPLPTHTPSPLLSFCCLHLPFKTSISVSPVFWTDHSSEHSLSSLLFFSKGVKLCSFSLSFFLSSSSFLPPFFSFPSSFLSSLPPSLSLPFSPPLPAYLQFVRCPFQRLQVRPVPVVQTGSTCISRGHSWEYSQRWEVLIQVNSL